MDMTRYILPAALTATMIAGAGTGVGMGLGCGDKPPEPTPATPAAAELGKKVMDAINNDPKLQDPNLSPEELERAVFQALEKAAGRAPTKGSIPDPQPEPEDISPAVYGPEEAK
jgi:hypothetical protein